MKLKKYLAGSLLAILSLTAACTNEQFVENNGTGGNTEELPQGAVQFKLEGINTGAVQTRVADGTVIASAQENRVDHLTIFVFGAEKENATNDEITFRDYWTSVKRADFTCDTETKTFALKGMGRYFTATIVVPAELKSTRFLFITNRPRMFNYRDVYNGTGVMSELTEMYNEGDDHLHIGHPLQGVSFKEAQQMLAATEAIDGVGVPTDYGTTVPSTLPTDHFPFLMGNDYFGFIEGRRETLAMAGVSAQPVSADGQGLEVTLHRNVARIDVSLDGGVSLGELNLTNIAAMSLMDPDIPSDRFDVGTPFDPNEQTGATQSQFSLMKTDPVSLIKSVPARSYCYPSIRGKEVQLTGMDTQGTRFTIPFVDKDTKQPLTIQSNHRYTIKLRRTSDNLIDANIIVEAWNVGEEIEVDLNEGDDVKPQPTLHAASNYEYANWENLHKVTCMVSPQYTLNSVNPATYPWLRFDLRQMSRLDMRMYYADQEVNFPGPVYDPAMKVHNTVESADGSTVRHELMVTQPNVSTQWLKLQNHFDPTLNHIIKIETGNMEATGTNAKTPALIAFAETNLAADGKLAAYPAGGFDGPYAQPVADWTIYRGKQQTAPAQPAQTPAGYALPTAKQLQCIAPDQGWGSYDNYNGANVQKVVVSNDVFVYYSGSPLDRNVVKVVVDRSQTGADLGTAQAYVNVEATLWHLEPEYLKINTVNLSMSEANAGRLSSYTHLMDLFNNKQAVSAGYTRFFPASGDATTAYLGQDGSALVFDAGEVKYVASGYAGNGYIRPVMEGGVMKIPAREPVVIAEKAVEAPLYDGQPANLLAIPGLAAYWVAPKNAQENVTWTNITLDVCPDGWHIPSADDMVAMAGVTKGGEPVEENYEVITKAFDCFDQSVTGFWTTTEKEGGEVYIFYAEYSVNKLVWIHEDLKERRYHVRCVRRK